MGEDSGSKQDSPRTSKKRRRTEPPKEDVNVQKNTKDKKLGKLQIYFPMTCGLLGFNKAYLCCCLCRFQEGKFTEGKVKERNNKRLKERYVFPFVVLELCII